MEPNRSRNAANINFGKDISQQNVYNVSQRTVTYETQAQVNRADIKRQIEIDKEVANLLNWLAEQQGISPELALKKAVVTAAYIYDITTSQEGKLLVKRKDNSIGEIMLK